MRPASCTFILLAVLFTRSSGQQLECGNPNGTESQRRSSFSSTIGFLSEEILSSYDVSQDPTTYTIGISLHIVRMSNGSGGPSSGAIDQAIWDLNAGFASALLQFEIMQVETINSDYYNSGTIEAQEELAAAHNADPEKFVNIYVLAVCYDNRATFDEQLQGWLNQWYSSACQFTQEYMVLKSDFSSNTSIVHEMGHYFRLLHTHEGILGDEELYPDFTAGDLIPDTPPTKSPNHSCSSSDPDELTLARNFMSASECRSEFTPMQVQKMRHTLALVRPGLRRGRITMKNTINSVNAGGSLRAYQTGISQDVASGGTVLLDMSAMYEARTLNERITGFQGGQTIYKHHDWNGASAKFRLQTIENVTPNVIQDARFLGLYPSSVLISTNEQVSGPTIDFRDPWYLHSNSTQPDSFFTISSPFYPIGAYNQSIGGVFIDQDPQAGIPVYYTVRAPQTQSVNGITWNFRNWSSTNVTIVDPNALAGGYWTTPVVFRVGATRTVTANYKAYLASNSSSILSSNGQRRMSSKSDGTERVLVYQSAGEIWSTVKSGSNSFGFETRISTGNGSNELPSITNRISENKYHVTWRRSTGGGNYTVYYAQRLNGVWSSPAVVGTTTGVSTVPLITLKADYGYAANNPPIYVLYNESASVYRIRRSTNGGSTWSNHSTLPIGTVEQSVSALEYFDVVPTGMTLSYNKYVDSDHSNVHFREYSTSWSGETVLPTVSSAVPLSYWNDILYMNASHSKNSQSLRYAGRRYFTFSKNEEYEWSIPAGHLVYQERDNAGNWSNAWILEDREHYLKPSLSILSGGRPVIEWDEAGTRYRATRDASMNWSVTSPGSGSDPVLSVSGGDIAVSTMLVSRGYQGGLHTIVPASTPLTRVVAEGSNSNEIPLHYSRMMIVTDTVTGAYYSIEVSQPRLGGRQLSFPAVNDTLPNITRQNFYQFFSTATMSSSSSTDSLVCEIRVKFHNWPKAQGDLIVNASLTDGTHLGDLDTKKGSPGNRLNVKMPARSSTGSAYGLSVIGDLPDETENTIYLLAHVYSTSREGATTSDQSRKLSGKRPEEDTVEDLPNEFSLRQNFPNPFNPSTMIAFGLDEPSHVEMQVFDLLGRLVETLRNGTYDAGFHSVTWIPKSLPSGTYLCRLVAVSQKGEFKTKSIRMQYLR